MADETTSNQQDALPPAFRNLKFDGWDEFPFDLRSPDYENFVWLYRAACMKLGAYEADRAATE